jgi:NADH-quinone oxidoreductase subunit E
MQGYSPTDAYKMSLVWGFAAALLAVVLTRDALPGPMVWIAAVGGFVAVVYLFYRALKLEPSDSVAGLARPIDAAPVDAAPTDVLPTPGVAPTPAPKRDATRVDETAPPPESGLVNEVAPTMLTEPPAQGADNLKRIKGIGPKLEQTLNRMGVYTFAQIAAWTPAEEAWVDDNLEGFRGRVSRDSWVEQAQVLAAGEDTDFSRRVDSGAVYEGER